MGAIATLEMNHSQEALAPEPVLAELIDGADPLIDQRNHLGAVRSVSDSRSDPQQRNQRSKYAEANCRHETPQNTREIARWLPVPQLSTCDLL